MSRIFREHIKRKCDSLVGMWRYKKENEREFESIYVPSVWNNEPKMLTYEGVCVYEKEFFFEGGTLRLLFDGVMTYARVYLDGEYIGDHYGGFTAFSFVCRGVSSGWHTLSVSVDNRFDKSSVPQAFVDWYHYGGITRGVSAEKLRGICIMGSKIEYSLTEDMKRADIRARIALLSAEDETVTDTVSVAVGGVSVSAEVTLSAGEEREITLELSLDSPMLWDINDPNLYNVVTESSTDDLIDRTGFRCVCVRDNSILLNGRKIAIKGVNRHEDHPEHGMAFPLSLMKKDLDLIKNMGCNAIRGSHYPNAREFLDLLDENGIMFYSEIPIWGCGFSESALSDPVVLERGLAMHKEMLRDYYNHPSIVMWGMHNEIAVDSAAGYEMSRLYYSYLKENGGNRAVVYASHKPEVDICFEFCDIFCLNLYFGWYTGDLYSWDKFLERFTKRKRELSMADKPIIFSEFGCAALFGCHDDENIRWSEEYQAKLLTHCLTLFRDHPEVVGSFIWQFSDIRTSKETGLTRARGYNNKGLVNEYRKPKLAYRAVKKIYEDDDGETSL